MARLVGSPRRIVCSPQPAASPSSRCLPCFPVSSPWSRSTGCFPIPALISQHVGLLTYILPAAALELLSEQLARIAARSTGSPQHHLDDQPTDRPVERKIPASAPLFDALNVIYREREDRTLVRFYATTFLFTLGGAAFLLLTISVVVVLPGDHGPLRVRGTGRYDPVRGPVAGHPGRGQPEPDPYLSLRPEAGAGRNGAG